MLDDSVSTIMRCSNGHPLVLSVEWQSVDQTYIQAEGVTRILYLASYSPKPPTPELAVICDGYTPTCKIERADDREMREMYEKTVRR